MNMAKSIEEAMALLKAGTSEEIKQPEAKADPKEGDKKMTDKEPEEEEDEETEEETEKGLQVDLVKSEGSDEMADFIKADDFMLALAQNQDANVEILAKGLEGNLKASARMLDMFKAIDTRLERIELTMGATPQPRRAVLHKGEAAQLESRMVRSPKDGEITLSKSDMVSLLSEGVRSGACQALDVVKAETGFGGNFSMGAVDVSEVVGAMSPGAQAIIRSFLQTKGT